MIVNEQLNIGNAISLETHQVNIANSPSLDNNQELQMSNDKDIFHYDFKSEEEEVRINSQFVNEEVNEEITIFFSQFNFEICCLCNQLISDSSSDLVEIKEGKCLNTSKSHFSHTKCIVSAMKLKFTQGTEGFCFDCRQPVYDQETFQQEVYKIKIEEIELQMVKYVPKVMQFSKIMGKLILDSKREEIFNDYKVYVCDKCNHPTNIKDFKNETDQQMSLIECEQCSNNFCIQCKQRPFHFGHTCISYKASLQNICCRFCKVLITDIKQDSVSDIPASVNVCKSEECQQLMQQSCQKTHTYCGHACCGTLNEEDCLPCLQSFCTKKKEKLTYGACSTDLCSICYTEELGQAPVAQLNCKHMFHQKCLATILKNRYSTLRISFGYLDCPVCAVFMKGSQCPQIKITILQESYFKGDVEALAVQTARREGVFQDQEFIENQDVSNYETEYAMPELNEANQPKKEDLLCVYCYGAKYGNNFKQCKTHDLEYLEHKCQYCCSVANWFCFGTTRFCDPCHNIATLNVPKICNPETCQWKGDHPPNGQPHCIGCMKLNQNGETVGIL
eukprot:403352716